MNFCRHHLVWQRMKHTIQTADSCTPLNILFPLSVRNCVFVCRIIEQSSAVVFFVCASVVLGHMDAWIRVIMFVILRVRGCSYILHTS
jgi:hypothetical protein